ncbi:MAG: helix-turn-helix domain-containing protein [Flavisolibacter sp.]
MQHVEFFHIDHFEYRYHRKKAKRSLSHFIDFFWETDFEELLKQYPAGFSDALFPNVGYTYLINLGTPFVMQLEDKSYEVRSDGFLPRDKNMICHHSAGNQLFGIKFKVSPVIFEKKVNFSEYKEYIFPLAYLIDRKIIEKVKASGSFNERVEMLSNYYEQIIHRHSGSLKYVEIVTEILQWCNENNNYAVSIDELSSRYKISPRTLQRYFEETTSITAKKALQIMRIRKAVEVLTSKPQSFDYRDFGYYDYSHFYRHLRAFIYGHSQAMVKPLMQLLKGQS